jgi:hypothetical protein
MGVPTCASLGQDRVPLMHDGYTILRIRVGSGGMTAMQRVEEIQLRMQDLMAQQFHAETQDIVGRVSAHRWGKEMVIGTPDCLLLTVTQADARANHSSAQWLANHWRDRMLEALIIATRTGVKPPHSGD